MSAIAIKARRATLILNMVAVAAIFGASAAAVHLALLV